jgi:hypothetical protein
VDRHPALTSLTIRFPAISGRSRSSTLAADDGEPIAAPRTLTEATSATVLAKGHGPGV